MSENEQPGQDLLEVEGILDLNEKNTGALLDPARGGKTTPHDPFLPKELIRRFKLRKGSVIRADANLDKNRQNPKIRYIHTVDGMTLKERKQQFRFDQLTTIQPKDKLNLEAKDGRMTTRVLDLFCPMGKGQRALIVAPPRAGKTTILHDIAKGVEENHPECHLMVVLIDERPEEVTDFRRTVPAEIYASSNDEEVKSHLRIAELAIERAKRLVESKKGVVLLLDSITRLSGLQCGIRQGGRTMTGGLGVRALEKPRQFFLPPATRKKPGRLRSWPPLWSRRGRKWTSLFSGIQRDGKQRDHTGPQSSRASALAGHQLASSGTRKEEDLVDPVILEKTSFLRRAMSPMKVMDAAESLIERMGTTQSNKEFLELIQTA